MVKISFNKFHNKWEVYFHKGGKNHIGYYTSMWKATMVRDAVNKALISV